jgi:NitT/TauT family transport system ATP-binding protein
MQDLLIELHRQQPCLIVFVTHDVTEAMILGDRVLVMSAQPGRIADDFVIDEKQPRSPLWLRSTAGVAMQQRILTQLHQTAGHGRVTVSV